MLPLEDKFNDIILKTVRGKELKEEEIARSADIPWADWIRFKSGQFAPELSGSLRKLAKALDLAPAALEASAKESWRPEEIHFPDGFAMWSTPYRNDIIVNSYLIWDRRSGKAAAFDTGTDCDGMLETLTKNALTLDAIYLTHNHGDHIMEIDRLMEKSGCSRAFIGVRDAVDGVSSSVREGQEFVTGPFRIRALETFGHTAGGITYVVDGLLRGVAVAFVGDAIFAGSMGGGMVSFRDAFRNNVEKILTLPDTTILCSGHGPLTTVGQEKKNNPFFARE